MSLDFTGRWKWSANELPTKAAFYNVAVPLSRKPIDGCDVRAFEDMGLGPVFPCYYSYDPRLTEQIGWQYHGLGDVWWSELPPSPEIES